MFLFSKVQFILMKHAYVSVYIYSTSWQMFGGHVVIWREMYLKYTLITNNTFYPFMVQQYIVLE